MKKPDKENSRNREVLPHRVYALEKLGMAVWKLATGIDGIKARLADAYIELAILQETDLPEHLVDEWEQIKHDLTNGKMKYEPQVINAELMRVPVGKLCSTLRFMRKSKAQDIARRICSLESKLASYLDQDEFWAAQQGRNPLAKSCGDFHLQKELEE